VISVTEEGSGLDQKVRQATLTIKTMVIRDGTPGISLSLGTQLIGEWTDSRAKALALTEDHKARVLGAEGEQLYLLSAPGQALSGEAVSDTELCITFEL
jgi:hypothetical protein